MSKSITGRLCLIITFLTGCLTPAFSAETGTAPLKSPSALIREFSQSNPNSDLQRSVLAGLVSNGAAAVGPILNFYRTANIKKQDPSGLIQALGEIDTPEAVSALREILAFSLLLPTDIYEIEQFLKVLVPPENAPKNIGGPQMAIWSSLPLSLRSSLREHLKAENKNPLSKALTNYLTESLNAELSRRDFYNSETFARTTLSPECEKLLKNHRPDSTAIGIGLSPLETYRMNRLLLEASFPRQLSHSPALALDRYRRDWTSLALQSLAQMSTPSASQLLVAFRPAGIDDQLAHIQALGKLSDPQVGRTLVRYLLYPDRGVSGKAMSLLRRNSSLYQSAASGALKDAFRKIQQDQNRQYPMHIIRTVLTACGSMLTADDAAEVFAQAILTKNPLYRDTATRLIIKKTIIIEQSNAENAMLEVLNDTAEPRSQPFHYELNKDQLLDILTAFRRDKRKASLAVAMACLKSRYGPVRYRACDLLTVITAQRLGRNPAAWKTWYTQKTE